MVFCCMGYFVGFLRFGIGYWGFFVFLCFVLFSENLVTVVSALWN